MPDTTTRPQATMTLRPDGSAEIRVADEIGTISAVIPAEAVDAVSRAILATYALGREEARRG